MAPLPKPADLLNARNENKDDRVINDQERRREAYTNDHGFPTKLRCVLLLEGPFRVPLFDTFFNHNFYYHQIFIRLGSLEFRYLSKRRVKTGFLLFA